MNTGIISNRSYEEIKISSVNTEFPGSSSTPETLTTSNSLSLNSQNALSTTTPASTFRYILNVNKVGNGGGSVQINPPGGLYSPGKTITITAIPEPESTFKGWSGSIVGTMNPVTLTMNSTKTITATFAAKNYALTVNIKGNGIVIKNPDQSNYFYSDLVRLTPVADPGFTFQGWSGDPLRTNILNTIAMDSNKEITATFILNIPGTFTLGVTPVGNGQVILDNIGPYYEGEIVQMNAIPNTGWVFQGWSGDLSGSTNPFSVTVTGNKAVTATFIQTQFALNVSTSGSGSVSKSPNKATYAKGDVVQLTASPASGYTFSGWSGDVTETGNKATITITSDKYVTVKFTLIEYYINILNVGEGTVIKTPDKGSYHQDDIIQLTSIPKDGWSFTGWSGDVVGIQNPITILFNGNKEVTVNFDLNPPGTYTLAVTPVGGGQVILDESGPYIFGEVVQLKAVPNAGWIFSGWSSDASGLANPVSVTMNGDMAVKALFTQLAYTITVTMSPAAGGSVTRSSVGPYHYGDLVTLTESPSPDYVFSAWSGEGSGTGCTRTITVTGNVAVTATFTQISISQIQYTLMMNTVGKGSVTRSQDKQYYNAGETIILSATPALGYVFYGWSGDGVSGRTNPITINLNRNSTVTANFAYVVNEQYGIYLYNDFDGNNNLYKTPYFIHGSGLGDYPLFRVVGTDTNKPMRSGITLSNVVIDDDWFGSTTDRGQFFGIRGYPATFSPVIVDGCGNSIKGITLRNCLRYGITIFGAKNFYIGYNKVECAQYCVSGSGATSSGGLIEYNTLRGMTNCGLKVKNLQNTRFSNNYVDLTPIHSGRYPEGVNFSDDLPNVNANVIIENNEFVRASAGTYSTYYTKGLTTDVGCTSNAGNKFINNKITNLSAGGVLRGVILQGDYFTVTGNIFTNCRYNPIINIFSGTNHATSFNTFS